MKTIYFLPRSTIHILTPLEQNYSTIKDFLETYCDTTLLSYKEYLGLSSLQNEKDKQYNCLRGLSIEELSNLFSLGRTQYTPITEDLILMAMSNDLQTRNLAIDLFLRSNYYSTGVLNQVFSILWLHNNYTSTLSKVENLIIEKTKMNLAYDFVSSMVKRPTGDKIYNLLFETYYKTK